MHTCIADHSLPGVFSDLLQYGPAHLQKQEHFKVYRGFEVGLDGFDRRSALNVAPDS